MGQFTEAVLHSKDDFQPYMQGGNQAMQQFLSQMGMGDTKAFDVTQLPGYQQSLQQGISAVNQGAAGAGMLRSGERLKSLQAAGQSVFGDYYNNYMNRLMGMTQMGMGATSSAATNQINALNALTSHRAQQQASGGGGSPVGDIMGAVASIFGTYKGSQ